MPSHPMQAQIRQTDSRQTEISLSMEEAWGIVLSQLGTFTIPVSGEQLEVGPLQAEHLQRLRAGGGSLFEEPGAAPLVSADSVLDFLTMLLDQAGHLGLPDGTPWNEKRRLVGGRVLLADLAEIADILTELAFKATRAIVGTGSTNAEPDCTGPADTTPAASTPPASTGALSSEAVTPDSSLLHQKGPEGHGNAA